MIFCNILKNIGRNCSHVRTIHHNRLNIVAFTRCDGNLKRVTAKDGRVAERRDITAFTRL